MGTVADFVPLLQAPVRENEGPVVEEVAASRSVVLPEDYGEIAGAYGDSAVAQRPFLFGARNLRSYPATGGLPEQSGAAFRRCVPLPWAP
ncbi:hypothetical protein [Kitasatospora sp. NPDC017646]|uniref:hypothetical protein n=1 Tax=Kitasatospora sp. NPDC017646 TaxID=3364024 RepID=UPI00378C4609